MDAYHLFILLKRYDFIRKKLGISVLKNQHAGIVEENVEENSKKMLNFMLQTPKITSNELQNKMNLSRRQVEYIINRLQNDELIIRHGSTKNGMWVVK